jgi:hypothetical protein
MPKAQDLTSTVQEEGQRIMTILVKKLSPSARYNVQQVNKSRLEHKLKPLEIKIRSCLACGEKFESTGMRTCGCNRNIQEGAYEAVGVL